MLFVIKVVKNMAFDETKWGLVFITLIIYTQQITYVIGDEHSILSIK